MNDAIDLRRFRLLAASVIASLATHLDHLPLIVLIPLMALPLWQVWMRQRGAGKTAAWIRLPLIGLLVVAVIVFYGNVFGREPGSLLGCGLLSLKMLETERRRDARVVVGFAAFVLMSALLFGDSLGFTLAVSSVLVLLLTTLVALQPAPLPSATPLRRDVMTAATLFGLGIPLALAAFVLIPRLAGPLWGAPGRDVEARTGLGEDMSPGKMTDLLIDDSPAFRVDFRTDGGQPPAPAQRYFRAMVLWDFDGTTWTRLGGMAAPEELRGGTRIDYDVTLEATDRRWLPMLDVPTDAPAEARLSGDRMAVAHRPVAQPRRYAAQSIVGGLLAPQLDRRARERALRVPATSNPRAKALAERWKTELGDDARIAQAALDLFRAEFRYSLSVPLLGRDSVDEFLFDTKVGYCEHYSSAFVFLMRAAGIPARVVTGYQGGWWNAGSNYLLVRQSDAHAWTEIWREGQGWIRIDPTAAVSPQRVELGGGAVRDAGGWAQSAWMRELRNRIDFVNRLWTEGVIRFDALRQQGLLTEFGLRDVTHARLLMILAGVLGFVLLLATLWALRSPRVHVRDDALDAAYRRLRSRLARNGWPVPASEGPLDLAERLRRERPHWQAALSPLLADYARLRYAVSAPDAAQVQTFARTVRRVPLGTTATNRHSAASR